MAQEVCPSCGVVRQEGDRFCGSCGSDFNALSASVPVSTTKVSPRRRSVGLSSLVIVLALGLASLSLLLTALQPDVLGCGRSLWGRILRAEDLPSGWSISTLSVSDLGWSGSITTPAPSGSFGAPTMYVSVTCSGNAAAQLDTNLQLSKDARMSQLGFRLVGDQSFALRSDSDNISAYWRVGQLVGEISTFSDVEIGDVETLAANLAAN